MICKKIAFVPMVILILLSGPQPAGGAMVLVGGYDFAPFVEIGPDGRPHGWTLDLIDTLNANQSKHEFIFVYTSPSRRYQDYRNGNFDFLFFEDPAWGWQEKGIALEESHPVLKGGEVYIARAEKGRGQEYFDDFKGKRLAGVLGYHYGLADYNADPDYLRQQFGMTLVESNKAIPKMILKGRADIAVITLAYLEDYLARNPGEAEKFIISDRFDQRSSYRILARPGFYPSAAQIGYLIKEYKVRGRLHFLPSQRD